MNNPAPIAVTGAVSQNPLFISRRNLDMPLRPQLSERIRRHIMDLRWYRTRSDKSRALECNAVTELARMVDHATVLHKKNDATALLQERHNPIRQLTAVLHLCFTEFKQAQIEFAMQLRVPLGWVSQERTAAQPTRSLATVGKRHAERCGLI